MTIADPYPETLDDVELGFAPPTPKPMDLRIAIALERIATALEQSVLEHVAETPQPAYVAPQAPQLATLPPVSAQPVPPPVAPVPAGPVPPQPAGFCPVHNQPWNKLVPAGTSKSTGRPYRAFWACPASGCNEKPPR